MASLISSFAISLAEGGLSYTNAVLGVLWLTAFMFVVGGLGCLPGLAIWLTILERIPPERTPFRHRRRAVATAPIIGAFWLVVFATRGFGSSPTSEDYLYAFVFGVFWPVGAGFVVRLRQRIG